MRRIRRYNLREVGRSGRAECESVGLEVYSRGSKWTWNVGMQFCRKRKSGQRYGYNGRSVVMVNGFSSD